MEVRTNISVPSVAFIEKPLKNTRILIQVQVAVSQLVGRGSSVKRHPRFDWSVVRMYDILYSIFFKLISLEQKRLAFDCVVGFMERSNYHVKVSSSFLDTRILGKTMAVHVMVCVCVVVSLLARQPSAA